MFCSFRSVLVLVAGCVAFPARALSQQGCQTQSLDAAIMPWDSAPPGTMPTLNVMRFDPSLGALAAVDVTIVGHVSVGANVENRSNAAAVVTLTAEGTITISRPNLSAIGAVVPHASRVDDFGAFDGVIDFTGPSGRSQAQYFVGTTVSSPVISLSTPSDLALFTGAAGNPGQVQLHARAADNSGIVGTSGSGPAVLTYEYTPFADVHIDVCYRYTLPINDAVSREVSVFSPVPDIAVSALTTPNAGDAGTTFSLQWDLTNVGITPTTGVLTERVYRTTNTTIGDADDVLMGTFLLATPIPTGATVQRVQTINYGFPPGIGYFVVSVSGDAEYAEENRTDNSRISGLVTILDPNPPKPDLTVQILQAPTTAMSGGSISVTYRVRNVGQGATSEPVWTDLIYLTTAPSSLTNPQLLGSVSNPTYLLTNGSYDVTTEVALPHDFSGTRYVAVRADSGNLVRESNEANNTGFGSPALTVALELQPDLVAINPQVSTGGGASAFSGQFVSVSWSDDNQGNAPTDSGTWRDVVYLSTNNQASLTTGDLLLDSSTIALSSPLTPAALPVTRTAACLLPRDVQGTHYVKILVDADQQVSEFGGTLESNNVAVSAPLGITLSPTPDLEAVAIRRVGTGPALAGHAMLVQWEVHDRGGAAWHTGFSWTDRIYLSQDALLDVGDEYLGSFGQSASPIGAPGSGNWSGTNYWNNPFPQPNDPPNPGPKSATVTIPPGLMPGDWYLLLVTDADNQVLERATGYDAELNNVVVTTTSTSTPEPIGVALVPTDLVIQPGSSTGSAPAGQSIPIRFTVRNQGAAVTPVTYWIDRVYLSLDSVLGPNDWPLLISPHNGALVAGASYSIDTIAPLPVTPPGSYRLIFSTDDPENGLPTGRVWELGGENNNIAVLQVGSDPVPIVVTPETADLVVSEPILVPPTASAGQPLPVTWTVTNTGTIATTTSSWTDKVYLSLDNSISGEDIALGSFTHSGALAAGDAYTNSVPFQIPAGPGGLYYVIVAADSGNAVFESNDGNNTRARRMSLNVANSPPANLVVVKPSGSPAGTSPVVAPSSSNSGQSLALTWAIKNTGTGPTNVGRWNDVVYLSLDKFLDPSFDLYLGTFEHAGFLGVNEERTVERSFVVPLGISGPRYVLVNTDATNDVFEGTQDSDNVASSLVPTTITLPPPCDLRVTDIQFPPTGKIGFRFPITWTTVNEGGSAASGSWTDNFYLSLDDTLDADDRLLGAITNSTGSLAVGGIHTQTQLFTLPGVLPASYHVLARSDARGQIPESDEHDNERASAATTTLSAFDIAPGGLSIQITPNNAERYFRLDVPPGPPRTLHVTFTHDSPGAWTELYASEGEIPRPGNADYAFTTPASHAQELIIPDASGQTFYVLGRATSGVGQMAQNAVLSVQELPFALQSIAPQHAGQGLVTLELTGSRLDALANVFVQLNGGSFTLAALERRVVDPVHALALFDFSAAPAGLYDLAIVDSTGIPVVSSSALTIEPAQPLVAAFGLDFAPSIKKGARGGAVARIENRGNVNLTHAVLVLGKRADPKVPVGVPALGIDTFETAGPRESLTFLVSDLGPSQHAELELEAEIASDYASSELVLAVSGAVFDESSWSATYLPSIAETLREAVLADPSSTAALRARAVSATGWLAAIVTHLPVATSGLFDPAARATLGRDFVTTLADAATSGLATNDHVPPAVIASVSEALACLTLGGAAFDCSALQPLACGNGTAVTLVTIAQGANTPVELVCCATPTSDDPNEKTHPKGHGAQQQLSSRAAVPYRIYFENVSTAAAPASLVQIEDEFEPTLKASSFRATRIVFGDNEIDLGPGGLLTCQRTVPLPDSPGLELQITSGVDAATNKAFWRLESVDADSGLPITDGVRGFLPPNDEHGNGAGHVEFLVNPNPTVVVTGTTASNSATVLFDSNAPIHTNRVLNTFDADSPLSGLTAAPVPAAPFDIRLQWSGSDPIGGAGLKDFTVYAARDDEPYAPILTDVATNAFVFHARPGSTYRFYSRGRDNTGNLEIAPVTPDATFVVPADCNGNGIPDAADVAAQTSPDCDSNLVPDECDPDSDGDHTIDACDGCPSDPAKTAPGVCGCGVAESASDSDGDGVVDCIDNCIAIANPTQSDCDADLVGDACEVAAGARDCNSNLVPDDCDIANATSVDANANAAPDECEGGPGSAFCAGDGVDPLVTTSCPCGNNGAAGNGCANSIEAGGASLAATGTTSPETIVLAADRMPQFALAIYTKSNVWSPTGVVSGDGVLCLGGSIVRMATKRNVGGSSVYPEAGDAALSQRSFTIPGSGATAYYQTYYRNAAATYCTAATINLTNAWQVVW